MCNQFCTICRVSNDRQNTVPHQKPDITTFKFKSKIQLQMGAHILWKVNIRFICMQAKMGPCMQSILIKARNNFCLTMCAGPVPGQGARGVNL